MSECNFFAVGDKDQRYQILFTDMDGKVKVMGWTDRADGGALVKSINDHPVWKNPIVQDRWNERHEY
jgi:hypothetical protein